MIIPREAGRVSFPALCVAPLTLDSSFVGGSTLIWFVLHDGFLNLKLTKIIFPITNYHIQWFHIESQVAIKNEFVSI